MVGWYDALIRLLHVNLVPTTTNWRIPSINNHKGRIFCGNLGDGIITSMAAALFPTCHLYLKLYTLKLVPHVTLL